MIRILPTVLALAGALGLAGCEGANPVRDLAVASGITGGEPRPAPDFVTRSRPDAVAFAPVGVSAPPRATRPKDAAAVTSAETEMDGLKSRNEARAASARRAGASPPAVAPKAPE